MTKPVRPSDAAKSAAREAAASAAHARRQAAGAWLNTLYQSKLDAVYAGLEAKRLAAA